jgi:hypothetical protein
MKKWYLQLNGDIITDVIEYSVEGYIEVQLSETHLPAGINGGWYRWNGTNYVLGSALKQVVDDGIKQQRKEENADLIAEAIDTYTLELIEGGLL